ncbi:coiled-coil domain-containing protein 40 isoform X1 [Erpetoichthys calabaricus]|uniref:coiled-coil domain-containing protein 40 isoform X1 n=1 Tax=Erpetoichthys calabaricus TaxID=27687 RepID=UPI0022340EF3|nr:coiled-coil domain-containing protein 40 isoform X1 [Erpetoichthys calabaricus]
MVGIAAALGRGRADSAAIRAWIIWRIPSRSEDRDEEEDEHKELPAEDIETGEPTLRSQSLDHPETDARLTQSHPASEVTSPRTDQLLRSHQLADLGETDMALSSAQDHSTFQVSEHLSDGSESEQEKENEDTEEPRGFQETDTESEEEEAELVVLDPNHPLMERFQLALRNHLSKQLDKLSLDIKDKTVAMKKCQSEREELGVVLYSVQQELARIQMALEKLHDQKADTSIVRIKVEEELENVRNLYKRNQQSSNEERGKVAQLQTEIDNLALRLFYMDNMNEDVRSDIAVMKRVTQKAETKKTQVEEEKQKQDLFIDRLTKQVDSLRQQIAMYEVQAAAQAEEKKAARDAVSEAQMEMEAIGIEKKQILNQWNSTLIGMRRRDEAYTAMQEALRQARQRVQSLITEADGYKKSITKEEERNELLTGILNRADVDISMTKKQISQCMAKQEALKTEYSTYTRTLHETEQALSRVTSDHAVKQMELDSVRKHIEKEYATRVQLEDKILGKMQDQLTLDKATKFSRRMTEKLTARTRQMEIEVSKVENEIAQMTLEANSTNLKLTLLQKMLAEMNQEIQSKNEMISRNENEIAKRVIVIERKQSAINLLNKKIEQIAASTGQEDMGPLELKIKNLTKYIEEHNAEITSMQQYWLREQNELVLLTREREEQAASVETLKKKLTILQQQKIRIENEIQQELNEQKDTERQMKNLSNDMVKLTMLVNKNSTLKESLQQSNILMENEFVHKLKESERESIEIKVKLESVQEEKDRLLNSLVEAERQIMLWEKKTQLAKETRAAVDSDVGQGEIRTMKSEIHRMEVRYGQLMKQQEKLIREMEAVVARRETIVTRGEVQAKMEKKQLTQGAFHSTLHLLQKKIHETQKQAAECDGEIQEFQDSQRSLSRTLDEKQNQIAQLQAALETLVMNFKRLQDKKDRNFSQILTYQARQKHLQAVKDGKYTPLVKTKQALEAEAHKQEDRIHTISTIVDRVCYEYPELQGALRKVTLALAARQEGLEGTF